MKQSKSRYKVAVIGAGNVGATLAMRIADAGLAEVVLVDINKPLAQGKALDIFDSAGMCRLIPRVYGTDDISEISGSSVVVVTAGLARRPGMTREELASKNACLIKEISSEMRLHAPESIVIVVTNPLDTMTYLAYKTTAFPKARVVGMAGLLDESRFKSLIAAELNMDTADVETIIMGSHGDTMVPILSSTRVKGRPLAAILSEEKIDSLVARVRVRGAEIVGLLGSGSAYYSPSLAVFRMIDAIIHDKNEIVTASAFLEGEYGLNDICIGVPLKLGRGGIKEIIRIRIDNAEAASLMKSAEAIRVSNAKL